MKKYGKITALIVGVVLEFGFASCKADTETEYVNVPTDMTSHDAVAVYRWKRQINGASYTYVIYEENADCTTKKDDADNSVKIETVVNVAANTKLSAIAKNFHGFKAAESDGFIKVPAGFFKRSTAKSSAEATGSNTHAITLAKDLYVCDHEVTQGEWCWDLYESPCAPEDLSDPSGSTWQAWRMQTSTKCTRIARPAAGMVRP